MDDILWWLTNNAFLFVFWLLVDEDGRTVAKIIWSLSIVFLICFIAKGKWDGEG
jgi:hypothetical protein